MFKVWIYYTANLTTLIDFVFKTPVAPKLHMKFCTQVNKMLNLLDGAVSSVTIFVLFVPTNAFVFVF